LYFCIAVNLAIVSRLREEESPDSTEQRTGEEPGVSKEATESATENNYHTCVEKVKT
jgi:hypothetical protein